MCRMVRCAEGKPYFHWVGLIWGFCGVSRCTTRTPCMLPVQVCNSYYGGGHLPASVDAEPDYGRITSRSQTMTHLSSIISIADRTMAFVVVC
jgi:hypothetical protein